MKNKVISFIRKYQRIPGRFHYNCKFYPTCSEYTIEALEKYGTLKGLFLGFKRILKCNPFSKCGVYLLK